MTQNESTQAEASPYNPIEQPPTSLEEALERIEVAREIHFGIETPVTELPDTPPRSFTEAVEARTDNYWLDREPLAYDYSVDGLIAKIDAPTPELTAWAAAKALSAQLVRSERVAASIAAERRPNFLPNGMTLKDAKEIIGVDSEEQKEMVNMMGGRIRVVIKDGRPLIINDDYSAALPQAIDAIRRHNADWEKKHPKVHATAPRLSSILKIMGVMRPYVRKGRINPNEPGSILDALSVVVLERMSAKYLAERADASEEDASEEKNYSE